MMSGWVEGGGGRGLHALLSATQVKMSFFFSLFFLI